MSKVSSKLSTFSSHSIRKSLSNLAHNKHRKSLLSTDPSSSFTQISDCNFIYLCNKADQFMLCSTFPRLSTLPFFNFFFFCFYLSSFWPWWRCRLTTRWWIPVKRHFYLWAGWVSTCALKVSACVCAFVMPRIFVWICVELPTFLLETQYKRTHLWKMAL